MPETCNKKTLDQVLPASCSLMLHEQPYDPRALHLSAILAYRCGRFDAAADAVRLAIEHAPMVADYHNTHGIVLSARSDLPNAITAFERAVRFRPDYPEAWLNLGTTLERAGKVGEALAALDRAIQYRNSYADAHDRRGIILSKQGRWGEAATAHRAATFVRPDFIAAWEHLAHALERLREPEKALECYRRIAKLNHNPEALCRLARVLRDNRHYVEAISVLRKSIEEAPQRGNLHRTLGMVHWRLGQLGNVLSHYRQAAELDPASASAHSDLIFALYHDPAATPQMLLDSARQWAKHHERPDAVTHQNECDPNRRLRIGYVSPDFRFHTISHVIEPMLAAHDRSQFEIICYSSVKRPDQITERLRRLVHGWRDIARMSDEDAAGLIRKDGIDILVDLTGHWGGNRLPVVGRKPAPVQMQIAFPGTTGLASIDYRITDAHSDPPGRTKRFHTEELLRLPCGWPYAPDLDAPLVGRLPALRHGYVTFGCLNRPIKVCDEAIALWRRILDAVPGSKLVVLAEADGAEARPLAERFERHGIGANRLELLARLPRAKYLQQFNRIDIALDTFPYNGETTTCDGLWMGVPIVALAGSYSHSRRGVSHLTNLGLTELIAHSPDQYVEIAAALAGDLPRLAQLRCDLRLRMACSTITDGVGYTRALEAAYRQTWWKWCHGSPLAADDVTESAPPTASRETLTRSLQTAATLMRSGQHEAAVHHLRQCIALMPSVPEFHNSIGCILGQMRRPDRAVHHFREAIRLRPGYPQAHNNLGAALEQLQYLDEALASYDRAIEQQPDFSDAHVNRSNVLRKLHRVEEAVAAANGVLRLRGENLEALNSLGAALLEKCEVHEARRCLERAVKMRPDFAEAHANLATALLMQGDYELGWREYAWRCDGVTASHAPQPWRGWVDADLSGKTVLIRSEGGFGNVIQFARYVPLVAGREARVIVECQPALVRLIRSVEGVAEVIAKGAPLPKADGVIPMRCLPKLFGTTLETIPAKVPYLRPDTELVGRWRAALDQIPGVRVGVCWQGSQALVHQRDRSFSSMELIPLARVEGVRLVSLQVDARPDPRLPVAILPGFEQCAGDFMATAALVKSLDLVITCDTAIAHLAGALGVRTWVALRWASDWRYGLDREDCAWYPTMRLFRQQRAGEWGPVFTGMAACLKGSRP